MKDLTMHPPPLPPTSSGLTRIHTIDQYSVNKDDIRTLGGGCKKGGRFYRRLVAAVATEGSGAEGGGWSMRS
jgi:hypothetical protein